MSWGISSNGRAPALHAGGTGIDTRILQFYFLLLPLLVLIIFLPCLYFSVVTSEVGTRYCRRVRQSESPHKQPLSGLRSAGHSHFTKLSDF